jgi:hypothetical protein
VIVEPYDEFPTTLYRGRGDGAFAAPERLPNVTFANAVTAHMGRKAQRRPTGHPGRGAADFGIGFEAEACVDLFFWEECWGRSVTLLSNQSFLSASIADNNEVNLPPLSCWAGGGSGKGAFAGAVAAGPGPGGQGADLPPSAVKRLDDSPPAIAVSPDGETILVAFATKYTHGQESVAVLFNGASQQSTWCRPPELDNPRDPAAAFLSNDLAAVAFTNDNPDPSMLPADPAHETTKKNPGCSMLRHSRALEIGTS